jgi:GT2 family glycosyltransferase
MCFRRDAIQRTDGYDEPMFWGAEEHGLALELLYHEVPMAFVPEYALHHRHAPRLFVPARVLEAETRNNIWIAFKSFPLGLAIPVAAILTIRPLLMSIIRRREGGAAGVIRGLRAGIAGIPAVLRRRKPVPTSRLAEHNRWFFSMFHASRAARVAAGVTSKGAPGAIRRSGDA